MKLSEFLDYNKRKITVGLIALGVCILAGNGVCQNVKAIAAYRETETPKVETLVVEKPVVIEPETLYFDVPLSQAVQDTIFAECEKHGISPAIVIAQIEKESQFDTYAIGDDGRSFGLMQIRVKSQLPRMIDLNCTDLFNPSQNVKVGIDYLAYQLDRYNGDMAKALTAYNRGNYNGTITEYAKTIIANAGKVVY